MDKSVITGPFPLSVELNRKLKKAVTQAITEYETSAGIYINSLEITRTPSGMYDLTVNIQTTE